MKASYWAVLALPVLLAGCAGPGFYVGGGGYYGDDYYGYPGYYGGVYYGERGYYRAGSSTSVGHRPVGPGGGAIHSAGAGPIGGGSPRGGGFGGGPGGGGHAGGGGGGGGGHR